MIAKIGVRFMMSISHTMMQAKVANIDRSLESNPSQSLKHHKRDKVKESLSSQSSHHTSLSNENHNPHDLAFFFFLIEHVLAWDIETLIVKKKYHKQPDHFSKEDFPIHSKQSQSLSRSLCQSNPTH